MKPNANAVRQSNVQTILIHVNSFGSQVHNLELQPFGLKDMPWPQRIGVYIRLFMWVEEACLSTV